MISLCHSRVNFQSMLHFTSARGWQSQHGNMKRDDQTRFELYTAWNRVETAFHSASSLPLVGNRMGNTGTSLKRGLQAMRRYN